MNPSKETIAANPDGTARLQSENVSDKSRISKAEAERDALEQKNKLLMESRNGDELSPEGNIQNLNIAEFPDPSKSVPTLEAMQIMAMQDALHEMWDTLPGHEGEHYECAMCGAVMYSCMDYTHNEDCPYEIGFNALDAFYDAWEKASANAAEPDKKPDTITPETGKNHSTSNAVDEGKTGQETGAGEKPDIETATDGAVLCACVSDDAADCIRRRYVPFDTSGEECDCICHRVDFEDGSAS
jgi:hypothetical protein